MIIERKLKVERSKELLLLCFILLIFQSFSQDSVQFKKFFYPSGKLSSEGYIVNGKPDRYWKNYYESGFISSEGNRKNYLLDSTWKFYNSQGKLTTTIDYKLGLKEGWKCTYKDSVLILKEYFSGDVKEGITYTYFENGKLKSETPYVEGNINGIYYEYSDVEDSLIILLKEFKNGIVKKETVINRRNTKGKQGLWITFYPYRKIESEVIYVDDVINGYIKKYNVEGKLLLVEQYENGKITSSSKDLVKHVETNNHVQTIKEVETVKTKEEGTYQNGVKVGNWKYFYENGKISQEGVYNSKGKPIGEWKWYYESGNILREENYVNGLYDGLIIEYSDSGKIVMKAMYVEGLKDGEWFYEIGDHREIGQYKEGMKTGVWKHYYTINNELIYIGEYKEDEAIGKHKVFYNSGVLKEIGSYAGGLKNGDWIYYFENTEREKVITFRNGEEWKVNGQLVLKEK